MTKDTDVMIVGGGIGGLVLALSLHQIGVNCRVYEGVSELKPLGAGINLLPHAVRELDELGLLPALDAVGIRTKDASYFNHHGQLIYREVAGTAAGYAWPQFSIHRGDLQMLLYKAVLERLGPDSVVTGHKFTLVTQDHDGVTASFNDHEGNALPKVRANVMVGCDGVSSTVRKQFYPEEGDPVYSGLTVWRGVTSHKPFLSGADTIRAGWMTVGKLMVYPIRDNIDAEGNQLMNWVATLQRPKPTSYDWNGQAKLEDFFEPYSKWQFDWAGQSILDARYMTGCFKRNGVNPDALQDYDKERVAATGKVVLMNRANPPDTVLRVVYERTGGKRFNKIEDVISNTELQEILDNYKAVAGFQIKELAKRPSMV